MVHLDPEQIGAIGQNEVQGKFERIGWGPIPNHLHDRGIDLVLQVRSPRGADLPVFVNAQVKAGDNWFTRRKTDEAGETDGWWFSDNARHIREWLTHSVPMLIVLYDIHDQVAYWQHITTETTQWSEQTARVLVPKANTVDGTCVDALTTVAGAQRVGTSWEGSIWRAGADIPAPDRIRHALIAPRLIAPHPNADIETALAPEQAIAMLMLARLESLDDYADQRAAVADLAAAHNHEDWRWRFAAAMYTKVTTDDVVPLLNLVDDVPAGAARAAASVAAAAALIQQLQIDHAVTILDGALRVTGRRSVDAAWLHVQRGRALVQVGLYANAQGDLLDAQSVRLEAPADVTATGIAGAAVKLLFAIAPWESQDLQAVVEGSDTATSWWRAQTTSYGLWKAAERAYEGWGRDRRIVIGGTNVANNQLEAAGLMATHVGDHGGWAELSATAAENRLVQIDRTAGPGTVADALNALRLAGDQKALEIAVQRIVSDGPASAVTQAAARIDLTVSTRTTAHADLKLLQHGGDVLDAQTASDAVNWLLATLADPAVFAARAHPTFLVELQLTNTLAAALPAASPADHRAVANRVCDLPPVKQQIHAEGWARVIGALGDDAWTSEELASVASTADDHHAALRFALLGAAARRGDENARQRLLEDALRGSLDGLSALGDVRQLPEGLVVAQIEKLAAGVAELVSDAHDGKFGLGGYDPAYALLLLNLWHPNAASWEPVLELLRDDAVSASQKRSALRLLTRLSDRIPEIFRPEVESIAAALARGVDASKADVFGGRSIAGEAALLAVTLGALPQAEAAERLMLLLSGDRADRLMAATLARGVATAEHAGILAALTGDQVPDVRAAAAEGLARRLAAGDDSALVLQALRAGVNDPGTLVASAIAATLKDATTPTALQFREGLRDNASAFVRSLAPAALSS